MRERETDILIVGGGVGGVAAALAAAQLGKRVILTEETDWLGGQMTAQAVPPDEHPWIEETGCTASYRRLRNGIRAYYRTHYPLTKAAKTDPLLNPGAGSVSRLCHEPRATLAVIEQMLAPYRSAQTIDVLLHHYPVDIEVAGDTVRAVTLQNDEDGLVTTISAPYILDATELGDLLELGNVEYVIGAESQRDTGEPHALEGPANPLEQQAITWCFALDYFPGEDHVIDRPEQYDFWRTYQADFWPGRQLGWQDPDPQTLATKERGIFHGPQVGGRMWSFWQYRRLLTTEHFMPGHLSSDISLVNWPHNDYWLGPLVGVSASERNKHLAGAKELSLSLLYWMQTEAPRHDGGVGYSGLRLRHDVVGTQDGLAKSVYVRESRRIQAEFTVLEQHVGVDARSPLDSAETFADSVGVGSYRIDLHPSTALRTYVDISSYPFQIPLGALIPIRVENLLPACKNLGVTHITNGCYRLHPVEWNIGEAAGALAAYCLSIGKTPRQVHNQVDLLADFQRLLTESLEFALAWPEAIRTIPQ
ncbi:FAD-dependent oxidoreductase [Chloroflexi bacterium TSY]|nr:FAD-dependent oxidoreductase [Chloroflexi bacterium TSY]